jgi:hypothetical protein
MTVRTIHLRPTRFRFVLAITSLATIGVLHVAEAGSAAAGQGVHVSGAGVRSASSAGDVPFTFSFDASATQAGEHGTFTGSFPHDAPYTAPGDFASFQAVVTCLETNGDTVTIGGVVTSGFGYDDYYLQGQQDLTGDWFITTVQGKRDAAGDGSRGTMGYLDWGDRGYFASEGFGSFDSLCDDPTADLGTAQFPVSSGAIKISD